MISRRRMLGGSLLAGSALLSGHAWADDGAARLRRAIDNLEHRHGGRLGVAVIDSANEALVAHRGEQRFALCSTFKFLAAACVLSRVDRQQESLTRRIVYGQQDLVGYSPGTEAHVGGEGLTVGEICEAAVTLSDNTAGNLMLESFGGPAALTEYLRALGDDVTRLDRREPTLNEGTPGDPRDTTTPLAMLATVRKTVLGTALSAASRAQLTDWLLDCKTGDKRLRAGVPPGWRAADKTGTGGHNSTNDIAVLWPPGRAPLIVTAYYAESAAAIEQRESVLSQVGRLAATL
jgi:beta-lactamase class A